jgi:hypothetical protein
VEVLGGAGGGKNREGRARAGRGGVRGSGKNRGKRGGRMGEGEGGRGGLQTVTVDRLVCLP